MKTNYDNCEKCGNEASVHKIKADHHYLWCGPCEHETIIPFEDDPKVNNTDAKLRKQITEGFSDALKRLKAYAEVDFGYRTEEDGKTALKDMNYWTDVAAQATPDLFAPEEAEMYAAGLWGEVRTIAPRLVDLWNLAEKIDAEPDPRHPCWHDWREELAKFGIGNMRLLHAVKTWAALETLDKDNPEPLKADMAAKAVAYITETLQPFLALSGGMCGDGVATFAMLDTEDGWPAGILGVSLVSSGEPNVGLYSLKRGRWAAGWLGTTPCEEIVEFATGDDLCEILAAVVADFLRSRMVDALKYESDNEIIDSISWLDTGLWRTGQRATS